MGKKKLEAYEREDRGAVITAFRGRRVDVAADGTLFVAPPPDPTKTPPKRSAAAKPSRRKEPT